MCVTVTPESDQRVTPESDPRERPLAYLVQNMTYTKHKRPEQSITKKSSLKKNALKTRKHVSRLNYYREIKYDYTLAPYKATN